MARGIINGLRKWTPNVALRNYRIAKGLSQAKLAEIAGLSQAAIHRYETGAARMTPEVALKLAPAVGRHARDLIPLGDDKADVAAEVPRQDRELLARGLAVGHRFSPGDRLLAADIAGLVYALLVRDRDGHPIRDDEGTLSLIDEFLRGLRQRGPS